MDFWLCDISSSVQLLVCRVFICWKQCFWNSVLLIVRVLLMMRMFGLICVCMVKVRCNIMLLEQVCMGWLMKFLMLVNVVMVLKCCSILCLVRFRIMLFSSIFLCLVKFGLKLLLSFRRVVMCLLICVWLVVGVSVLVMICSRVDLLELLCLMMFMVLFCFIFRLILCRVQNLCLCCCDDYLFVLGMICFNLGSNICSN